jgi:protein gp37
VGETSISWCDYTFNVWWGCFKVSPGCTNCYANTFDRRVHGKKSDHWERTGSRRFMSPDYWEQPLKWNRDAEAAGVRKKVFCGSMCDWLEQHPDPDINRAMDAYRGRLFELIKATPWLDWLLLTKRIDQAARYLPWMAVGDGWMGGTPWPNVWIGSTVESAEQEDRINVLRELRAVVRFLSCEPLLGLIEPIDLRGIHWLIAGAESGHRARACDVEWLRALRDQCRAAGTAFFLKQAVWRQPVTIGLGSRTKGKGHGGDMVELPYLDGKQHAEFPEVAHAA